jgi:hypothetical protein
MAFWSGNGGGITIGGGSEQNIGRWEVNSNARLVENTHSGTGGSTNFNIVVYDNSSSIEIPVDDTALPDTDMGLVRGSQITIVFQMGNSGKTCTLTSTTVENFAYINDPANDIVRARVTTRGGVFTAPTT